MMKPIDSINIIRAARTHFNGFHWDTFVKRSRNDGSETDFLTDYLTNDINVCIAELQSADSVFSAVREAIIAHTASSIDPEWYLERYADVAVAGIAAEQHYQSDGRKEGRFPNALSEKVASLSQFFDDQWYLERYGDVAEARIDPRQHFLQHGQHEGRFPNGLVESRKGFAEWFDAVWYLNRYLDVAQSGQDPREHYVKFGAAEGRNPNSAAECNTRSGADDFAEFICRLKKTATGHVVDYFEYRAWLRFYRLGLTKDEIRRIILHPLV